MSGDEFKEKLDIFFEKILEIIKEKEQIDYINTNYNQLKDLCIYLI